MRVEAQAASSPAFAEFAAAYKVVSAFMVLWQSRGNNAMFLEKLFRIKDK